MKKYSFLVFYKEYEEFLMKLQELGAAHIVEKDYGDPEDGDLIEKYNQIPKLKKVIEELKKRNVEPSSIHSEKDGMEILSEIALIQLEKESNNQYIENLNKELKTIEPWGEFSWTEIDRLKEADIVPRFYICPVRQFRKDWLFHHFIEKINEVRGNIHFVLFDRPDNPAEIEADEIKLPRKSLYEIQNQVDDLKTRNLEIEQKLNEYAEKHIPNLENAKDLLASKLSFDKVVLNTSKEAEDKLMIVEGWIPEDKIKDVNSFLSDTGVYYEVSDPTKVEKIPIKLKNNRFAKLFEVIGDLYSRPDYNELDLTPYFAPFYWLFFGFCLGDAGYGIILTILGVIMIFKASEKMKNTFKLVSLLGISTIMFGIIGGTFFGISLYDIKFAFYADIAKKFDEQGKTINDHLFTLALAFGAIQIIYGMFIKVANEIKMFGLKHSFGTLGWLVLILGNAGIYMLSKNGIDEAPLKIARIIIIAIGGSGAFLFNNPDRNILLNFGSGFWDAYNMLTGLMGDILSYIRLFALGISSAILGYVFNNLAVAFAPDNLIGKILVMGVVLAIGHGLNIFMASLGAFVHPVRLTFVEFYKNAGFNGGGIKYSPFQKKEK